MYNWPLRSKLKLSPKTYRTVFVFLIVVAAALRIDGLFNDFWLDEIWGWAVAQNAKSWLDPILRLHVDTNHVLNSLWTYWLGDRLWLPLYRLPSLAAGIATVCMTGLVAREEGMTESLTAVFLATVSFILILYSSEARAYSFVTFFALCSVYFAKRYLDEADRWALLWLTLCIALGFLAHLTFLQCYGALAVWSFYRLFYRSTSLKDACRRWIECHAGAGLFLVAFYFLRIRPMTRGGAPPTAAMDASSKALTIFFGAPNSAVWAVLLGATALGVVVFELIDLHRQGSDEWVFYATAILVSPAALTAANPIGSLFPRYYLIGFVFFLPILSRFLVRNVLESGASGRILFSVILTLYSFGNATKLADFYHYGRGQYLRALRYMAARTPGNEITVGSGSENNFANSMILRFYSRYLPPGERILYFSPQQWTPSDPKWVVIHEPSHTFIPQRELIAQNGSHYLLEKEFPYSDLSGWNWFLYRLKEAS